MALDTLVSYNNFVHPCGLTTKMTVYIFVCVWSEQCPAPTCNGMNSVDAVC